MNFLGKFTEVGNTKQAGKEKKIRKLLGNLIKRNQFLKIINMIIIKN